MTERRQTTQAQQGHDTKRNVYQRLLAVQAEVKGPRAQRGKFGASRSAESLLAEAKPVAVKHGLLITANATGEIDALERRYVVITVTATNVDDPDEKVVCSARAWEGEPELTRDGRPINDPPQVTGKSDSYAMKFALQHLLAIGGEGDPDTDASAPTGEQAKAPSSNRQAAQRRRAQDAAAESPPQEPVGASDLRVRAEAVGRDVGSFLVQRGWPADPAQLTPGQHKTAEAWVVAAEKAAGAAPQSSPKAGNGQAGRSVPKGGASGRRTDLAARVLRLPPEDRGWLDSELRTRGYPTVLDELSDEQVTVVLDEVLSAVSD